MSTTAALPPSPALFIHTSMWPSSVDRARRRGPCTCSSSVTSHSTVAGRRAGLGFGDGVGRLAESALVEVGDDDRRALLRRSAWPVAKPMPVPAAAVTTTVLPASRPRGSGSVGTGAATSGSLVGLRLAGQAERPLADDVALDLVGPAVDGVGPAEEEQAVVRVECASCAP